jgi:glucokinase
MGTDGPTSRHKTPLVWNAADPPALSEVLDAVAVSGAGVLGGLPCRAVVAWPGPVSPDNRVLASPTVSGGTQTTDIRGELSRRWSNADVRVINDLAAAGLQLCESGLLDFAILTVGSGVGHKVFVAGMPMVGPTGRGGELGHLLIDRSDSAPRCDCGGKGHLGAVASGRAIVGAVHAIWSAQGRTPSAPTDDRGAEVVAALHDGDPVVRALVAERARILGWGLATLHTGVGVDTFVLVGGFALAAGELFRSEVALGASQACWDLGLDWDRAVTIGKDEDSPGLHGAWLLARRMGWS